MIDLLILFTVWSDASDGAGLMLSLGAEGALGFVVSHELVHGKSKLDHWLAHLMLCTTGYMHWSVSHIAHHAQVSQSAGAPPTFDNVSYPRMICWWGQPSSPVMFCR